MSSPQSFKCKVCQVALKSNYGWCWNCRMTHTTQCAYHVPNTATKATIICEKRVAKPYKQCYEHNMLKKATSGATPV